MSQTPPATLSFDGSFGYPDGFRLEVSFEGQAGVTTIAGPSGSGKSTTLALIAGLLKPDAGAIRCGKQTFVDTEQSVFLPPHARRAGVVFQEPRLLPHLSVEANIDYGRRRRKTEASLRDHIVGTLELDDLKQRRPRSLSGGEQQRVALARALASQPAVLLLDEPLTAIDVALREKAIALIEEIVHERSIPTILVSHDQQLIARLGARVVRLSEGRVQAD